MEILINWESIKTEEQFYEIFLPQMKSPKWHGHNLDALNDSLVTGQINSVEPPYTINNINSSSSCESIIEFQRKVFSIFVDASLESKDVEVIIRG